MTEPTDALITGDATIQPIAEFELVENAVNKPKWRLGLYPDYLLLHPPDNTPPYKLRREEVLQKVEMSIILPGTMIVKLRKRLIFRGGRGTVDALMKWIGSLFPELLKKRLKRQYAWALPLAIGFVLLSLPLPGIPERDVQPKAFDPYGLLLGLVLAGLWVAARIKPHRVLFLLMSIWSLALSVGPLQRMLAGHSWVWAFFLLFILLVAWGGYCQYRQFDPSRFAS